MEFTVKGMSCNHCVRAVTQEIQAIDAQALVEVDLAAQKVKVQSKADTSAIAAAIGEAGYEVVDPVA